VIQVMQFYIKTASVEDDVNIETSVALLYRLPYLIICYSNFLTEVM
jgi:hypothetical protein